MCVTVVRNHKKMSKWDRSVKLLFHRRIPYPCTSTRVFQVFLKNATFFHTEGIGILE